LALVVGMVLGVGIAFVREHLDLTVRTVDDLNVFAVPVLGLIPSAPRTVERGSSRWANQIGGMGGRLALQRSSSAETELALRRGALKDAFLSLRMAVLSSDGPHSTARSLLVTSAQPGDGKTTIAVNLAMSLAQMGR